MDEDTSKKTGKGGKDKIELPRDGRKRYVGDEGKGQYKRGLKGGLIWIILFLVTLFAVSLLWTRDTGQMEISYTVFRQQMDDANISSALIDGKEVTGQFKEAVKIESGGQQHEVSRFKVWMPAEDPKLPDQIWEKNPGIDIKSKGEKSNWSGFFLTTFIPILFLVGIMILLLRQMEAGGNRAFSFGRSRAKLIMGDRPKVTFEDVAGADEAKEELQEVIEFLRDPRRFQKLGGRIPKGALLLGAPGTGKTLLARAVAGEAGVPFFSISGSDFVEMFVGVGASRVRDLFDQGKKHAPCIIFIDEIDAVGRQRGAGLGGGHDEREQTLNQLLVEMDGFESNEGVILLAATNRPDVLDPALLRPGRFDRQIVVDMPDVNGREGILKVHTRKIPLAQDVDLKVIARGTPGLSGADLSNIVNEAALLAARRNRNSVFMADFEEARDKVMMGPERKSLLINEEERRLTAFHEAGHALVARMIPGADPLHKVTIVPRGRALGITTQIPVDDKHSFSRTWLLGRIAVALGGRAAEMIVFNDLTTGAQEDIEKATTLARKMVCEWGMSEEVGPLAFGPKEEQIFLGREIAQHRDYSEQTAVLIDKEVRKVVDEGLARAEDIVAQHLDNLKDLASALLEREILDREEVEKILKGEKLPPIKGQGPNAGRAAAATSSVEAEQPATAGIESGGAEAEEIQSGGAGAGAGTGKSSSEGGSAQEEAKPSEGPARSPEDMLD